jgi:hypothetical protein
MKPQTLVLLIFIPFLSACQGDDLQALKDEVIDIHDDVMPLMDPLYSQRMRISKMAEADTSRTELPELIREIQLAEEAMMQWMQDYEPDFKGDTPEETHAYFESQKEKITEVNKKMKSALKKAKAIQ